MIHRALPFPSLTTMSTRLLLSCLALGLGAPLGAAIKFTALGQLPGGSYNQPAALSADGSTIVGKASSGTVSQTAFRWTAATGLVDLGDLPGGTVDSYATAVSADGAVVAGHGTSAGKPLPGGGSTAITNEGFRWTAAGGMTGLGALPGSPYGSEPRSLSSDGSVIVGYAMNADSQLRPFRWTAGGGLTDLGLLAGASYGEATAVSADGTVVIGYNYFNATGNRQHFRWTAATGLTALDLVTDSTRTFANALSADGNVVVGYGELPNFARGAFRWSAADGYTLLGDLAGGRVYSEALAVSADGSVIVGRGESSSFTDGAFVWDAANGLRSIRALLTEAGQAVGWSITAATGVSADGKKVIGYGTNKSGQTEGWLLDLDAPPPPPATVALIWTEDLPQTEAFKANSVLRLALDNGTGKTDIATHLGASNGGFGGVEYANGLLLVPNSATAGTGTRSHLERYRPILVTNASGYDLDATPGQLWRADGTGRSLYSTRQSASFTNNGLVIDRTYTNIAAANTGLFTNALQVVGTTIYFSNSSVSPAGLYKIDSALVGTDPVPILTAADASAPSIYDFEVVGDYVYFGDITTNSIKRVNTDGTGLVTLVANAPFPYGIDVTEDAIYWTELMTGKIRRSTLTGGDVTDLLTDLVNPRGVAVVPLSFVSGPAPQAISVTGLVARYTGAIDTPVPLTVTSTSGLPVTLQILSGPATVNGSSITYTGSGNVVFRATQAGDANYAPTTLDYLLTAAPRLGQTITFTPLPNLGYAGTPLTFTPTATASSGLPVSLTIVAGGSIATRDTTTGVITITGTGTVTLRATQSGNTTYAPATFVERTFTVTEGAIVDAFADYLAAQGVPVGARGPLDDPDGDGLGNLLEFALGLAPGAADPAGAPAVGTSEPSVLSFTYRRAQPTEFLYEVETNTDLANAAGWTTAGVNQGSPDANGLTTATVPLDTGARLLRLKITRLTP